MLPETIKYQETLANYCRTGKKGVLPGITPNRLHHYHRLVNNVIHGVLEQAFPITENLLPKKQWESLIYDFFTKHDCKTPQIWKMPSEFYEFVKKANYTKSLKRPYLNDLLYFEWIEIEIHCMEDAPKPISSKNGRITEDTMVFNPEYKILQLEYPVHITTEHKKLSRKGSFYLLVFRDYENRQVHFINLGAFSAVFLTYLLEDSAIFDVAFERASKALNVKANEHQKSQMSDMLLEMKKQGFLLGFK